MSATSPPTRTPAADSSRAGGSALALRYSPVIHWGFAFTTFSTLCLIIIGGLVTSHGAGMAVPDWPTTYGYNMFLFPISQWVGGIFYEHTHRLVASFVGFEILVMTVIVNARGLFFFLSSRGVLFPHEPRAWVRGLTAIALVLVVIQGLLGGFRVIQQFPQLGIFHGCLAQAFFCVAGVLTLVTSRWWIEARPLPSARIPRHWRRWVVALTVMIFMQLILGATMRHAHLGLAIHDFPLAYGQIWPDTSPAGMERINTIRDEKFDDVQMTNVGQVHIHMTHRFMALLIMAGVWAVTVQIFLQRGAPSLLRRGALVWTALVAIQATLGAATVLSNKAADVATAHVAVGSLLLLTGVLLSVVTRRVQILAATRPSTPAARAAGPTVDASPTFATSSAS